MDLSWDIPVNTGFLNDKAAGLGNKIKGRLLAPKMWAKESERKLRC
jgi:hypothetical protein